MTRARERSWICCLDAIQGASRHAHRLSRDVRSRPLAVVLAAAWFLATPSARAAGRIRNVSARFGARCEMRDARRRD
ncbi:hypothetical protein DR62_06660 [Burkholderia thailandensis]|nr:hypothetical protein DR62_06660 [Burkholderia thailandensis]